MRTLPSGTKQLLEDGLKHHLAGRLAEAADCCRRVLAAQPEYPDALHLLGIVADQAGRHDVAAELIGRAIEQNQRNAAYFSDLGVVLVQQNKLDEAAAAYRQAIAIKPDLAVAHSNLGNVLKDQGKLDEAVAAYRQAIAINPDLAEFYSNLAAALKEQGAFDEAVTAYRDAIRVKPDHADAHSSLGATLFDQGKLTEGLAVCRQAIVLNPKLADAHANLGVKLMQLGHLPEARAAFEEAIRLAPRNPKHRRILGNLSRFAAGDPHLTGLEELTRDADALSLSDMIELHFALAKAYEDLGRHREAFHEWLDGNALKRRQITYDEAAALGELDCARSEFTSELIRKWQHVGNPSSVPLFIVGMPRSGTTLIEQILASHPKVFGGGELLHFRRVVRDIQASRGGVSATIMGAMADLCSEDYLDLGTRYLAEIQRLAPGAAHITDKMPANFVFAGLIHLALPNATIIHMVRDPVDTCLSCFSKLFVGGQNHTYDLAELGRYYRHYQALMAHWHRVLPAGRILDVRYEDLVADLEGQVRRILAHCGLDWDPGCLAFHQTERPVRTASAAQVRQPIYNTAIGRGHVYEEFLEPLFAELEIAHSTAADS